MNNAVQLYDGNLSLITMPIPKISNSQDVLIQVKCCGVCGTDLHIIKGEFPAAKKLILGHEFAGVVSEVGEAVTHVKVGDRQYNYFVRFLTRMQFSRHLSQGNKTSNKWSRVLGLGQG